MSTTLVGHGMMHQGAPAGLVPALAMSQGGVNGARDVEGGLTVACNHKQSVRIDPDIASNWVTACVLAGQLILRLRRNGRA